MLEGFCPSEKVTGGRVLHVESLWSWEPLRHWDICLRRLDRTLICRLEPIKIVLNSYCIFNFFCTMHADKYCMDTLNTHRFSDSRRKLKNLSLCPCTFRSLLRLFLIKNNLQLHVPSTANFFDVLYRVKLNGCTRGITGLPETQPENPTWRLLLGVRQTLWISFIGRVAYVYTCEEFDSVAP